MMIDIGSKDVVVARRRAQLLKDARRWVHIAACLLALALLSRGAARAQAVTGSGTQGHFPMFTGPSSVGDSIINQNGGRIEIGTDFDPAFALQQTSGTPDAGYIRFGDSTGWRLHIARSRERSAGPLNTGPQGILMTITDKGDVSITRSVNSLEVRANIGTFSTSLFASRITTNGCSGCNPPSDRGLKANFSAVNPHIILDRLASIPIQTWNYKSDPESVRHIGATAQDFRAAFQLGNDDKTLNIVDAHGVTMAAIQGLRQLSLEQQTEIEEQRDQLKRQRREIDALKNLICPSKPQAELCEER